MRRAGRVKLHISCTESWRHTGAPVDVVFLFVSWKRGLTDAVAPGRVQHEAMLAGAPVAAFGVEAFGVLAESCHRALVDVCGKDVRV